MLSGKGIHTICLDAGALAALQDRGRVPPLRQPRRLLVRASSPTHNIVQIAAYPSVRCSSGHHLAELLIQPAVTSLHFLTVFMLWITVYRRFWPTQGWQDYYMAGMRDHFHFHHDIVANASRIVHHLHKRCAVFDLCPFWKGASEPLQHICHCGFRALGVIDHFAQRLQCT